MWLLISSFLFTFFVFSVVHFICDYPLQGDFLSRAKNHKKPFPGVPWCWAMVAHCTIQAAGVWLVSGSSILAVIEFVAHFIIDFLKCDGKIDFNVDQILHLGFKLIFAVCIYAGMA